MAAALHVSLVVAALLGPAEAPAKPQAPEVTEPVPQGPRPLVISAAGISIAELRAALKLRIADRELVDASAPRPATTDFVDVVVQPDASVSYTLITAEGLAFDRTLPPEDDRVRALASAIANLTFAIEAGTITPDRVDVEQPPPPEPEPEPPPEPEPTPEPVPPPKPIPPPKKPAPPQPTFTWDVAPTLDGGAIVALAPTTDTGAFAAGFARIGIDARHRRGGLVGFGVRVGGHDRRSLALVRMRFDVGGGWVWRWRRFELLAAGAITLEPWWIRDAGVTTSLRLGTRDATRRPLVGALARIAPGVRIPFGAHDQHGVRIGPRLELGGSFVPQDGARTVVVAREDEDELRPALRLGGLELSLGLDVTLWFGIRDR